MKWMLILCAIVSQPALADDARIVDFTTPIIIDGKPIIDEGKCPVVRAADGSSSRECTTPYTVGEIVYLSLQRPTENQTWDDALKRDDLARNIRTAKNWPLLKDQLKMIQDAVGPIWGPAIIGAVAATIDPR